VAMSGIIRDRGLESAHVHYRLCYLLSEISIIILSHLMRLLMEEWNQSKIKMSDPCCVRLTVFFFFFFF